MPTAALRKTRRPDDQPLDILSDPNTGQEVWVRELWDGGDAYVIIRRDPLHPCHNCDGEGHIDRELPWNGDPRQMEPAERRETCTACSGTGYVEAIYGFDADGEDKILWPKNSRDTNEVRA